jgi:formylglycine-generating enzyme required for sulfatase activity
MKEQWEMEWKDYYKILMVDVNADRDVIDAAYKRLASKHHPDNVRHGDAFTMRRLTEAAEVLRDRDRRAKYDSEYRKRRVSDSSGAADRAARLEAQLMQAMSEAEAARRRERTANQEAENARKREQEALDELRRAHEKEKTSVAAEPSPRQDEVSAGFGARKELALDLGGGLTMNLVLIPAGKFLMGSPETEKDRFEDEGPQREVTITYPFFIGTYEVTKGQYGEVVGGSSSGITDGNNPAEGVSWDDAVGFCRKLSAESGKKVRLPTEAEWEHACRAGARTRFSFGDNDANLGVHAWYGGNSDGKPHPVGDKKPNAFGLYDMHGNVWEWCGDWFADSYAKAKDADPTGPNSGSARVLRGGPWNCRPRICRSAARYRSNPDYQSEHYGFRVAVGAAGVH